MTGWGSGYVTDITYMTGYYRQQSPSMIALGCLLGGVASPMPGPDDPLNYLELGCGQGFGAMVAGGEQSELARHRDRLQSGAYRSRARLGGRSRARQHPVHRGGLRDLRGGSRVGRSSAGGFRQPARRVELGATRRSGRHRPPAAEQGDTGRGGACQLQFAAGVGRGARHAARAARVRIAAGFAQ